MYEYELKVNVKFVTYVLLYYILLYYVLFIY